MLILLKIQHFVFQRRRLQSAGTRLWRTERSATAAGRTSVTTSAASLKPVLHLLYINPAPGGRALSAGQYTPTTHTHTHTYTPSHTHIYKPVLHLLYTNHAPGGQALSAGQYPPPPNTYIQTPTTTPTTYTHEPCTRRQRAICKSVYTHTTYTPALTHTDTSSTPALHKPCTRRSGREIQPHNTNPHHTYIPNQHRQTHPAHTCYFSGLFLRLR